MHVGGPAHGRPEILNQGPRPRSHLVWRASVYDKQPECEAAVDLTREPSIIRDVKKREGGPWQRGSMNDRPGACLFQHLSPASVFGRHAAPRLKTQEKIKKKSGCQISTDPSWRTRDKPVHISTVPQVKLGQPSACLRAVRTTGIVRRDDGPRVRRAFSSRSRVKLPACSCLL